MRLGPVDFSRLNFVQIKLFFIEAVVMKHSYSIRKTTNKEKMSLVEPKGSINKGFLHRYWLLMWNKHITYPLPRIIPLFIAAKITLKGQQALKLITYISCCLFLMACSSTKVHLYGKYLSEEQIEQITLALKDDFDIEVNQLSIPQKVQVSSLIYSPLYPDKSNLELLTSRLLTLGFDIENISPLVIDNYWYTGNDIGVMLLPSVSADNSRSRVGVRTEDLANTYQAQHCAFKHKIIIGSDYRYHIELVNDSTEHVQRKLSGSWRVRQFPYLEFKPDKSAGQEHEPWFYFEISKAKEVDMVSAIELIKLKPVQHYPLLNNCHFAFGLRM